MHRPPGRAGGGSRHSPCPLRLIDKATGLPSVLWYDEFVEVLTVESQRILLGEISVEEGLAVMQEKCEALEAEYAK